ncbi:MAG: hypothetical protein IJX98_05685 [Clostridia bacterium]|nr:hypothetical protein [Clostridia bacterium]
MAQDQRPDDDSLRGAISVTPMRITTSNDHSSVEDRFERENQYRSGYTELLPQFRRLQSELAAYRQARQTPQSYGGAFSGKTVSAPTFTAPKTNSKAKGRAADIISLCSVLLVAIVAFFAFGAPAWSVNTVDSPISYNLFDFLFAGDYSVVNSLENIAFLMEQGMGTELYYAAELARLITYLATGIVFGVQLVFAVIKSISAMTKKESLKLRVTAITFLTQAWYTLTLFSLMSGYGVYDTRGYYTETGWETLLLLSTIAMFVASCLVAPAAREMSTEEKWSRKNYIASFWGAFALLALLPQTSIYGAMMSFVEGSVNDMGNGGDIIFCIFTIVVLAILLNRGVRRMRVPLNILLAGDNNSFSEVGVTAVNKFLSFKTDSVLSAIVFGLSLFGYEFGLLSGVFDATSIATVMMIAIAAQIVRHVGRRY